MRGILINPHKEEISEIEVGDGIHEIYRVIDANLFEIVRLTTNDALYVDEEGLLKENRYFSIPDYLWTRRNIAGKALILSYNDEGDTFSTQITVNSVEAVVRWLPEDHVEKVQYHHFVEIK